MCRKEVVGGIRVHTKSLTPLLGQKKSNTSKEEKSEVSLLAWLMRLLIKITDAMIKLWFERWTWSLESAAWHYRTGSHWTRGGNHEDSQTLQTVIRHTLNVCWCTMIVNDTSYVWSIRRRLAVSNGSVRGNSRDFVQRRKLHDSILSALIWNRDCITNA